MNLEKAVNHSEKTRVYLRLSLRPMNEPDYRPKALDSRRDQSVAVLELSF
jgi:hypothetical protein